jgi:beta-galactosidase
MKTRLISLALLAAVLLVAVMPARAQEAARNVVANGNFEQLKDGWAEGWTRGKPGEVELVEEEGNHFVRFTLNADGAAVASQKIKLEKDWQFVDVSIRLRAQDIKRGSQHWQTARLEYTFQDKDGKHVGPWPWIGLRQDGSTDGWQTFKDTRVRIPDGAEYLNLGIGMWVATGTADIDDVTVTPIESAAKLALKTDPKQADAIRNGDFASIDPKSNLPTGWSVHGDAKAMRIVKDEEGRAVLRIQREQAGDSYLAQRFPIHPWWEQLNIGVDVHTEADFESGKQWRQGANLRYRFFDADGKQIEENHFGNGSGEAAWRHHSHAEKSPPPGAVEMEVLLGVFGGKGTAEFRQPHVKPKVVERKPGETPKELTDQWAASKVETISDHRARMSLDGQWLFQPGRASAAKQPTGDGWGAIKVPGNWHDAVTQKGLTEPWQFWVPKETSKAWYKRTVTIPSEWSNRAVVLRLDRVSTDAKVWINGKEAGEVRWPAGNVDLTPHVKFGEDNELLLMVLAVDDRTEVTTYMGYVDEPKSKAELAARGLIGGVDLLSRPRGAYVYDVLMRPSTRAWKLDVDIELANVTRHGQLQLKAEMLNEAGEVEKTFEQTLPIAIARGQKVTASWPWENPRLFDVGQPNRYTMRLHLSGPGFQDTYVQPFGFREFWIDGRKFFLNNKEIRLRPSNLQYGAMPKQYLDRGYTYGELWPDNRGRRGSQTYDDKAIAEADQVGFLVGGKAMHMMDFVGDLKKWQDPATKEAYRRMMELDLRRWWNSPSVVMWAHTANSLQSQADGSPWLIGMTGWSNYQEYVDRHQAAMEAAAMIKSLDPTRPVYAHHGTYNGDVYTSNMYLNFIPLQEREEWLSVWAQKGEIPFMAVEFGPPLYASLMRGRDGYAHQGHSEPFLSEWCAVYLGSEAYKLEPSEYRKLINERYKGNDLQKEYDPHWRQDGKDRVISGSPAYRKLLELFAVNTWRSWRTIGVTGGMIPWHHDDANDIPALKRVNGPSLAWIAGPGGPPLPGADGVAQADAFTEKDHSFNVGQKVNKQVALLNDHRRNVQASYEWKAFVVDREVGAGKSEAAIELDPAGTKLFPIEFTLPSETFGDKVKGRIELTAKIGADEHKDTFEFEVFAPIAPAAGVVTVFDPTGDTSAMLKALGYETKEWASGNASGELLVIGRKTLSAGYVLPGEIQTYLANGGRVLLMGQDPSWTNHALNLRTAPHLSRRVFRVSGNHAVAAGLDDNDLRDWSGQSRVVEPYPHWPGYEWTETFGWHWGNRGAVASGAIEKPHRSGLRPILEAEFDLAYSPLMELDYGRGRLMLCALDLEDHFDNTPAARKLARQVVEYARTSAIPGKSERIVYLGGAEDAKTLDLLGVKYEQVEALDRPADLLILGRGATIEDSLVASLAGQGAKVLVMRQDQAGQARLGAEYEQVNDFAGSIEVPDWPEAAGLSASDLRWRSSGSAIVLKDGNEKIQRAAGGQVGKMPVGQGLVIFAQLGPEAVAADEKRYFRFTRWRQTRALAQILANLGASFTADDRLISLIEQPEHVWMLAGRWQAQLTNPKPESKYREWNSDPGMTDRAKELVKADGPQDGWETVSVPAYMESYGEKWRFTDGEAVFRKTINVPKHLAGKDLFISVGRVDENEITFFNGQEIGRSRQWLHPRGHRIPGKLVKAGENVIAIRVWDEGIHGGICGSPDQLLVRVAERTDAFYHPDYLDFTITEAGSEKEWAERAARQKVADNPYRYYRW